MNVLLATKKLEVADFATPMLPNVSTAKVVSFWIRLTQSANFVNRCFLDAKYVPVTRHVKHVSIVISWMASFVSNAVPLSRDVSCVLFQTNVFNVLQDTILMATRNVIPVKLWGVKFVHPSPQHNVWHATLCSSKMEHSVVSAVLFCQAVWHAQTKILVCHAFLGSIFQPATVLSVLPPWRAVSSVLLQHSVPSAIPFTSWEGLTTVFLVLQFWRDVSTAQTILSVFHVHRLISCHPKTNANSAHKLRAASRALTPQRVCSAPLGSSSQRRRSVTPAMWWKAATPASRRLCVRVASGDSPSTTKLSDVKSLRCKQKPFKVEFSNWRLSTSTKALSNMSYIPWEASSSKRTSTSKVQWSCTLLRGQLKSNWQFLRPIGQLSTITLWFCSPITPFLREWLWIQCPSLAECCNCRSTLSHWERVSWCRKKWLLKSFPTLRALNLQQSIDWANQSFTKVSENKWWQVISLSKSSEPSS